MPGYFPKGGGWPAIAKTTPGLIRGTVSKNLELYVPSMNKAILAQLQMLNLNKGGTFLNEPEICSEMLIANIVSVTDIDGHRMHHKLF